MKFKQFLLNEVQHISLGKPTNIDGVVTDGIDFRFEDWKNGFNQPNRRPFVSGRDFFDGSFSAPLQNGYWLNVSRDNPFGFGMSNTAIAVKPVQISRTAQFRQLPNGWFDFAIMYMGNHVVKSPEWPRDKYETQPLSAVELD